MDPPFAIKAHDGRLPEMWADKAVKRRRRGRAQPSGATRTTRRSPSVTTPGPGVSHQTRLGCPLSLSRRRPNHHRAPGTVLTRALDWYETAARSRSPTATLGPSLW